MQTSNCCNSSNPLELADKKLSALRILLVETNSTNQMLILRQLQRLGCCADVVSNGSAAVAAIAQTPYDIVLMDCQGPGLDAFDTISTIREWESRNPLLRSHQVIVIAMTASSLEPDHQRAIAVGMNDCLIKPVSQEDLETLLESWSQFCGESIVVDREKSTMMQPEPVVREFEQASHLPALALHLDWNHLHQISDNSTDFELELLQIFLEDSYIHLEALKKAIAVRDLQQVEQSAHHVKGASANVGARIVQSAAEQLEKQACHNKFSDTDELLAKMEFSLQQISEFIGASTS